MIPKHITHFYDPVGAPNGTPYVRIDHPEKVKGALDLFEQCERCLAEFEPEQLEACNEMIGILFDEHYEVIRSLLENAMGE